MRKPGIVIVGALATTALTAGLATAKGPHGNSTCTGTLASGSYHRLVVPSGETCDGTAAAEHGLVTTAVAADQVDAEVERVVTDLGKGHPQGLREAKRLVNAGILAGIERDGEAVAELSARLFASEEAKEAMLAFLSRKR